MPDILPPGTTAPDFNIPVAPDRKLSLSELRGRPVVLAFYPADWSPVCGDQMALYNEILPEFQKYDAELIGISVDGVWCHAAFAKDHHLHSRWPRTSSRRVTFRRLMEPIVRQTACRSERCLSSTARV